MASASEHIVADSNLRPDLHFAWWSPNFEEPDYKPRPPFLAPKGTRVVSREKPVTSSAPPLSGKLSQVTDGVKEQEKENLVELPKGLQWVQVDLGRAHELWAVLIWHNFDGGRVYFDVIGEVSNDPEFKDEVFQFYNNDYDGSAGRGPCKDKEYLEDNEGRLVDLAGYKGRYVRIYGKANVRTDTTHFLEIEVWGKRTSTRAGAPKKPIEIELPEPYFGGLPL